MGLLLRNDLILRKFGLLSISTSIWRRVFTIWRNSGLLSISTSIWRWRGRGRGRGRVVFRIWSNFELPHPLKTGLHDFEHFGLLSIFQTHSSKQRKTKINSPSKSVKHNGSPMHIGRVGYRLWTSPPIQSITFARCKYKKPALKITVHCSPEAPRPSLVAFQNLTMYHSNCNWNPRLSPSLLRGEKALKIVTGCVKMTIHLYIYLYIGGNVFSWSYS